MNLLTKIYTSIPLFHDHSSVVTGSMIFTIPLFTLWLSPKLPYPLRLLSLINNEKLWDPSTWPREARGVGYTEASRGALAHWIGIKNGKIDNYQAVVPSTWNAGPRDAQGQPGPYEAALKGHQLHDPKQPIEILRTIHSFDPCIACAVHVTDTEGEELIKVKVV